MRVLLIVWLAIAGALPASAATKFYMHESVGGITGYKAMNTSLGAGVTTAITNTAAGPTTGIQMTKIGSGTLLQWVSCPLQAVTISGTVTMHGWGLESNNAANAGLQVQVKRFTTTEASTVINSQAPGAACQASGSGCTELNTVNTAYNWTGSPTPTTFADGDRLVVEWYINDANGTMTGPPTQQTRTVTFRYDGTTTGASGDTWVQFNEAIACAPPYAPAFFGGLGNGTFRNLWTATGSVGAPTLEYNADAARWGLRIQPPTDGTQYIEKSITGGTQKHTLHLGAVFTTFPPNHTEQRVATICAGANCAAKQAVLTLQSDTSGGFGGAVSRLRLYFKDLSKKCSPNSLWKFSSCTTQADCPSDVGGNPNEADCGDAYFIVSEVLDPDTYYSVGIVSASDTAGSRPHDVALSLYVNGQLRGGMTQREGTCTGGDATINGKACGATEDCTYICQHMAEMTCAEGSTAPCQVCASAGTCTGTTGELGPITSFRIGADVANGPAMQAWITDDVLTLSDSDPYARYTKVVQLYPSGNGTNTWDDVGTIPCTGSHWGCVDDMHYLGAPVAIDNDETTLQTATNEDEIWSLTDYTPSADETVVAATAWAASKETAAGDGNTGKNLTVGLRDATTNELLGTTVDMASFNDASNYQLIAGPVTQVQPGSGPLDLSALRGLVRKSGPAETTGYRIRVTDFVAEAVVAQPLPAVTDLFPDTNGDGQKTLCIGGDSIMYDQTFYTLLNGIVGEPNNILACARGGRMIGDFQAVWTDMLDGSESYNGTGECGPLLYCCPKRGVRKKCDVFLFHIGANNFARPTLQNAEAGYCFQRGCVGGANDGQACTTTAADCPGGTCTDYAGPQNGGACTISTGNGAASPYPHGYLNPRSYCVGGDAIGTDCTANALLCTGYYGRCVVKTPGTTYTPTSRLCTKTNEATDCARTPAAASEGCTQFLGFGANDSSDNEANYGYTWGLCQRAEPGRAEECSKGVCEQAVTTSYMAQTLTEMAEVAAARTGGDAVKLVLAGNTMPASDTPKVCVAGLANGSGCDVRASCTPCATNADCPTPGRCKESGLHHWENGRAGFEWFGRWEKTYAAAHRLPFLDLGTYQTRKALNESGDPNAHVRDYIHESDAGQVDMATLIGACVNRDTSLEQNNCNDLQSKSLPVNLYRTTSTGALPNGSTIKFQSVGVADANYHVNAIMLHAANVTAPLATAIGSIYTLEAGNVWTKVSNGCDTLVTAVESPGWVLLPVSDPSSCALTAGRTYYIAEKASQVTQNWTASSDAPLAQAKSSPFADGFAATYTVTIGAGHLPWYLKVQ